MLRNTKFVLIAPFFQVKAILSSLVNDVQYSQTELPPELTIKLFVMSNWPINTCIYFQLPCEIQISRGLLANSG